MIYTNAQSYPTSFLEKHQLFLYFVLTIVASAAVVGVSAMVGVVDLAIFAVLTPTLIAIAITAMLHGRAGVRALLVDQTKRIRTAWVIVSLFLFGIVAVAAILLYAQFGGPQLALRDTDLIPPLIVILIISLGEEYGWRGYALPLLQRRFNALNASLILGVIWGMWHFPASLIGVGVPQEMPFYIFLLWVIPATILFTWIYNHTQSVLSAILLHSSANATFNFLPLLPEFTGQIQTFYMFLLLIWIVTMAVVFWYGPTKLVRAEIETLPTASADDQQT